MTTVPATTVTLPTPPAAQPRFWFIRAAWSIVISIVVNAIFPYLTYRGLAPDFPRNSVVPLLASSVWPVLALAISVARRRRADVIAIISLVEILIGIAVTLLAQDVRLALIARALQGTLTGFFFLFTILFSRPLFYYVAKQFVAAASAQILAGFEEANRRDKYRTFRVLTAVWGAGTILVSLVNLALALTVAPASYVLLSPIISIGMNVAMAIFSVRFSTKRLTRAASQP